MKKIGILIVGIIAAIVLAFVSSRFFKQNNIEDNMEVPKEVVLLEQKYSNIHQDNLTWDYNETSRPTRSWYSRPRLQKLASRLQKR